VVKVREVVGTLNNKEREVVGTLNRKRKSILCKLVVMPPPRPRPPPFLPSPFLLPPFPPSLPRAVAVRRAGDSYIPVPYTVCRQTQPLPGKPG
jgi:hypothetical protein